MKSWGKTRERLPDCKRNPDEFVACQDRKETRNRTNERISPGAELVGRRGRLGGECCPRDLDDNLQGTAHETLVCMVSAPACRAGGGLSGPARRGPGGREETRGQ